MKILRVDMKHLESKWESLPPDYEHLGGRSLIAGMLSPQQMNTWEVTPFVSVPFSVALPIWESAPPSLSHSGGPSVRKFVLGAAHEPPSALLA